MIYIDRCHDKEDCLSNLGRMLSDIKYMAGMATKITWLNLRQPSLTVCMYEPLASDCTYSMGACDFTV